MAIMRFSRSLKSSSQSLPSPDGAFVATLFPSQLSILSTHTLSIERIISLPPDLLVTWFQWSSSSSRILLGSADTIRVFSLRNAKFNATIYHPSPTKTTLVTFGGQGEDEVLVYTEYGLKLSVYNLASGKGVDINAPKFYSPGTAAKGYTYRPHTGHLTLLTRNGGKDVISIHAPNTLDVVRSWIPQSIDAQGISWSKDGKWIVIWESASQGHKCFIYTSDGHLFKTWNGPFSADDYAALGAGLRSFEWSGDGAWIAVGDYSSKVSLLAVSSFAEGISLVHPANVDPRESLQIWQEQMTPSQTGGFEREFIQATQSICPPTLTIPTISTETKTGTNLLLFDSSSTLLATRLETMPSTLWIWDIASTRSLRAVIILHSNIAKVSWHPSINELLMISCENERGVVHLWDPSWESPRIIDFRKEIPGGKIIGKSMTKWVEWVKPTIFFSDEQDCLLGCIVEEGDSETLWGEADVGGGGRGYGEREESPLMLVPAERSGKGRGREKVRVNIEDLIEDDEEMGMGKSGGSEEMDDTFQFRRFVD